jgi:hypothetical protein
MTHRTDTKVSVIVNETSYMNAELLPCAFQSKRYIATSVT